MWIMVVYVLIVVISELVVTAIGLVWIKSTRYSVCRSRYRFSSPSSGLDGFLRFA
jgi:hypothetical protein